ncbi:hypothetical protein BDW66DRAFT_137513 [Aspergillus desertorum]
MASTPKLFSGDSWKSPFSAAFFAAANLGSGSDLLPLACRWLVRRQTACTLY